MTIAARKAEARRRAFALRREAHARHHDTAARALSDHLAGTRGAVVAGYLPIRTEADPLPAMHALAPHNRITVPVIAGPDRALLFREWTPGCELVRGAFDVMIPAAGAELVPDLLIVPLVAFDERLFRLGYGGGYYDRTLEALRAQGPVHALGFAYAAQRLEDLPTEPTDQPLDAVVTERGAAPLAP